MNEKTVSKLGSLRTIAPDELELMLSWRNAPRIRANMFTRHEISLEEHLAWWARIETRGDQRYFMYLHKSKPLGIVAFNGIDTANGNSSWAFYTAPEAPKGTGSRMGFLALEYVFNVLKLHKLCGEALAFNIPSINFHQKLGFKVEGILREQHRVDDAFVDSYSFGILMSEWQQGRGAMLEKLLKLSEN